MTEEAQSGQQASLLRADCHNDSDDSKSSNGAGQRQAGRLSILIAGKQVLMGLQLEQEVAGIPAQQTQSGSGNPEIPSKLHGEAPGTFANKVARYLGVTLGGLAAMWHEP